MTGPGVHQGAAAYGPYELLRALVDRVGWPTEAERAAAHASIAQMEQLRVFGTYAATMECEHPDDAIADTGVCTECGRKVASHRPYRIR